MSGNRGPKWKLTHHHRAESTQAEEPEKDESSDSTVIQHELSNNPELTGEPEANLDDLLPAGIEHNGRYPNIDLLPFR